MKLESLRNEIDNIDSKIFDLLTERLSIVKKVGEIKKTTEASKSIIRPGREALMVKNIYQKAKDKKLPDNIAKGFAYIWRQIISVAVNYEENTNISYLKPCENSNLCFAREYFGIFSEYRACEDHSQLLKNIKSGKSNIGILPINRTENTVPWWLEIANNYHDISIFTALPFFDEVQEYKAVAVSNITPEPSGNDIFVYAFKGKLPENMKESFEVISEYKNNYLLFSRKLYNDYNTDLKMRYIGCFARFCNNKSRLL